MQEFLALFSSMGYLGITILMAIESSFVPLPSEVIIPPAGYLANQGDLNLWLVILFGVVGSILGALFNYFLAKHLGTRVIHRLARSKWAKWFLISPDGLTEAEEYFRRHGAISTFIGRLLPGIRHLISIPAGLAKMNLTSFLLFTALGSAIWCTILALLGYWFGANQAVLHQYYQEFYQVMKVIAVLIIIALVVFFFKRRKHAKKT